MIQFVGLIVALLLPGALEQQDPLCHGNLFLIPGIPKDSFATYWV